MKTAIELETTTNNDKQRQQQQQQQQQQHNKIFRFTTCCGKQVAIMRATAHTLLKIENRRMMEKITTSECRWIYKSVCNGDIDDEQHNEPNECERIEQMRQQEDSSVSSQS